MEEKVYEHKIRLIKSYVNSNIFYYAVLQM